jgi:DNA polymerase-4
LTLLLGGFGRLKLCMTYPSYWSDLVAFIRGGSYNDVMDGDVVGTERETFPAPGWEQAVLHVDMDAFYVNVHRLDHPEDVGVPLVVGGRPNQRGVVASASYEARQFKVRSAMATSQALRLCPNLKIVPANWQRIRECSRRVMETLAEYGPLEQMSVDEAYVDLSEWPDPEAVASVIQHQIKESTQLPCSIGLATNKLVAKVASDRDKPEGRTIVRPGHETGFLDPLPTRVLWGVGPRTAERLAELGIYTCGQLAAADPAELGARFGRQTANLQQRARGVDERRVIAEPGMAKSISQEWTFSRDVSDATQLEAQLHKMSAAVAKSLRKQGLIAYTVKVKFRWADFTTFTRQKTMGVGTDDEATIDQLATAIWQTNWPPGQPMRLLGVGVSKLEKPEGRQLNLDLPL